MTRLDNVGATPWSIPPAASRQQGAVLIVVLWVILALSLLALSFSASIRTEVNAARNSVDQKQSYYMARAGIEYAVYKIIESQTAFAQVRRAGAGAGGTMPPIVTGTVDLSLADGRAEVQIIDETGKININLAPPHLIYNLLIMVGVDEREADAITDSVEDWRDPDDLNRPNGAENDYYQRLEKPYLAKNSLLDVPEELLLVRGVTPEIYYGQKGLTDAGERVEYFGLQKYFTTFTTVARINVNSAPVSVLAAIPGLDYEVALRIDAMRQAEPIVDLAFIMERIPGLPTDVAGYLSTMPSNVFTLVSQGHVRDSEVVGRVRCVIRMGGMGQKPYTVLYWNESDVEL